MRFNPKFALYGFEIILGAVLVGWLFLHQSAHDDVDAKPIAVHDPELGPQLPPVAKTIAPAPVLAPPEQEFHGRWSDEPFWVRLKSADVDGRHLLQLVYTPPPREQVDGTILADCPFLLLDAHAGILAWNGRHGLSEITRGGGGKTYQVTRELQLGEGAGAKTAGKLRTLTIEPVWDLRLAPLLIALTWTPESSARMRLMDFFGPRIQEELYVEWRDTEVTLAGLHYSITLDDQKRFKSLEDAEHRAVIVIEGRP